VSEVIENFFASCPKGSEEFLAKEAKALGLSGEMAQGGIAFSSPIWMALELMIRSGVASRVMREIATYPVHYPKDIHTGAVKLPWTEILDVEQTIKVSTIFDPKAKALFKNSVLTAQILKDAVADHFRNAIGRRPNVDLRHPDVSLVLRIETGSTGGLIARVLIDMCGEPLSQRGIRLSGHDAPLRENLAAALVRSTDWKPESEPLIDPLCGSGTILIEAFILQNNIPPSFWRLKALREHSFACLSQLWFTNRNDTKWDELYARALSDGERGLANPVIGKLVGHDINPRVLEATKKSLRSAGIPLEAIILRPADARSLNPLVPGPGVVLTNPPYGERMGEQEEALELYSEIGENLKKNFKGFRAYLLAPHGDFKKVISLRTSQKLQFWNGDIECRLLKYDLF
jgi:23S rRNA G2445 N2-methylase RlmL